MTLNHPNQKPVDDKDVEDLIELFIERQNIGYDEETNVDNLAKDLETYYQKKYLGLKQDFIREFTNDHLPNTKPRWLRGIALDEQDLLDKILKWFDEALANMEGE